MPSRFLAVALLAVAAGCWNVTLGAGDIDAIEIEDELAPADFKAQTTVEVQQDAEVISTTQAADYLERFGPDKIGAIEVVELTLTDRLVDIDGDGDGDGATFLEPPKIMLAGERLDAIGQTVQLDEMYVDTLRAGILSGGPVILPVTLILTVAGDAPDLARWPDRLHIVVVVQPTLKVDATKSL